MDQQSKLGAGELLILFKFIPSSQPLRLRQVSTVWNEGALPILRKRLDLNFTLTDYSRNLDFFNFLNALPENGFVASVMKLKMSYGSERKECTMSLAEGAVYSFPGVLIEICKIFGTRNGPVIKKFILESDISSALLLLMIRHLSPSLEILDMESEDLDFPQKTNYDSKCISEVIPETHELMLALFKNRFPLNNLKKIQVPNWPSSSSHQDFLEWLGILVKSAPNLTNDPISEYRYFAKRQEYGLDMDWDENVIKEALANEPPPEESTSVEPDEDLSPVQLGNDELELNWKSAPNPISECRVKCGLSADDNFVNANVEPQSEEDPTDSDSSTSSSANGDLASVQLGTDELEIVSKFIPSLQLLELRRVSKVWNEAAVPVLRKRHDLKFTLTEDAKRNYDFLKFLRNLPDNGFVASEMKVRVTNPYESEWIGNVVDLERGSVETPLEIWIEICKIFSVGMSGRAIRKLNFDFGNEVVTQTRRLSCSVLASGTMLLMLRHLYTSLEILDLEWGFGVFGLKESTLDKARDLFKNRFPFTKLKMIVPPSHEILRNEEQEKALVRWLNILVQSAPNLTNDPVAECKVDPSEYYDEDDDYSYTDTWWDSSY